MHDAHIRLADIAKGYPEMIKHYDEARNKILLRDRKLSNNDRAILMALLKLGKTNVYKLSKAQNLGHYSTVLRALRRMRKWNLVRILSEGESNRSEKVFVLTLFGEYMAILAKGGWMEVAERIAETSQRFRECIKAYQNINKYHYLPIAENVLIQLMHAPRFKNLQPDINEIVITAEHEWIMESVLNELHDREDRPEAIRKLKRLSTVDWIRSLIFNIIDEETAIESEWLNTLANFRKDLKSAERNAKLTQFANTVKLGN